MNARCLSILLELSVVFAMMLLICLCDLLWVDDFVAQFHTFLSEGSPSSLGSSYTEFSGVPFCHPFGPSICLSGAPRVPILEQHA